MWLFAKNKEKQLRFFSDVAFCTNILLPRERRALSYYYFIHHSLLPNNCEAFLFNPLMFLLFTFGQGLVLFVELL